MAVNYYLAPCLGKLREQVNELWPDRSKASDGWIGDTAHAARVSDHNPDSRGVVHALDVTTEGIDRDLLIEAAIRDPRTKYVISRSRIWTPNSGWQKYTGSNPHNLHTHISVKSGATEQDTSPWKFDITSPPAPDPAPGPDSRIPSLPSTER